MAMYTTEIELAGAMGIVPLKEEDSADLDGAIGVVPDLSCELFDSKDRIPDDGRVLGHIAGVIVPVDDVDWDRTTARGTPFDSRLRRYPGAHVFFPFAGRQLSIPNAKPGFEAEFEEIKFCPDNPAVPSGSSRGLQWVPPAAEDDGGTTKVMDFNFTLVRNGEPAPIKPNTGQRRLLGTIDLSRGRLFVEGVERRGRNPVIYDFQRGFTGERVWSQALYDFLYWSVDTDGPLCLRLTRGVRSADITLKSGNGRSVLLANFDHHELAGAIDLEGREDVDFCVCYFLCARAVGLARKFPIPYMRLNLIERVLELLLRLLRGALRALKPMALTTPGQMLSVDSRRCRVSRFAVSVPPRNVPDEGRG